MGQPEGWVAQVLRRRCHPPGVGQTNVDLPKSLDIRPCPQPRQRIVVVIGLAAGLYLFGSWLTIRGEIGSGWVAYAPLSESNSPEFSGGLHSSVRLLIWLVLIALWAGAGVLLLRSRSTEDSS